MSTEGPLLALESVTKEFDALEGGDPVTVLRGVRLEIQSGEVLGIIGPSGCGKSTLLNIMGSLDRPTSGRVLLDGRDLTGLDADELARVRNREIGFIFQFHHLLPQCSVLENVLIPTLAEAATGDADHAEERARRLLERVGLGHRLGHRPGQLSGGERQRVAVVRALINEPRLLLADEPTGALDRASAENLTALLGELNREEKVALVVVTHAPELARHLGPVRELIDGRLQEGAA